MATTPRNSITVGQLRKALAQFPDDKQVKIWLPGSVIYLTGPGGASPSASVFLQSVAMRGGSEDIVMIEGNLEPGSALE